tara:strand:- start:4684 stop:5037 length:354 start_codon:yes stop_codon:yes gene_type:complete
MLLKNTNKILKNINKLCNPAYFYLIISLVAMTIMLYDNINSFNTNTEYCVGDYKCHVPSTLLVFAIKLLYIAFWTFALNCLCSSGYVKLAWFIVLLPFLLFFVIVGLVMIKQGAILK